MPLSKKQAQRLAIANIKLEGYKVTPHFEETMQMYWNGEITMLEALERQDINTSAIPDKAKERLRKKVDDTR
ncbi:MAG: antitoxin VbhA family protein [Neptuniibacter sp.]